MTVEASGVNEPIQVFGQEPPGNWRFARRMEAGEISLSEVHATIPVPELGSWLRRLLAFSGPGYMISVGYMDPGNWARHRWRIEVRLPKWDRCDSLRRAPRTHERLAPARRATFAIGIIAGPLDQGPDCHIHRLAGGACEAGQQMGRRHIRQKYPSIPLANARHRVAQDNATL
jgi:hypothetical protein